MAIKTQNSTDLCVYKQPGSQEPWENQIENQDSKICAVAKASLIELAVSLSFGIMALGFTASTYAAPIILGAIILQTIVNTGLRRCQQLHDPSSWISFGCNYMRPFVFSCFSGVHLQVLIHETGHALAARALFRNANPLITISPLLGGHTTFCTSTLSTLGQKLGKARAICLIAAMGPIQGLAFSAALITIGYLVKEHFSELSNHLIGWGRGEYWTQSLYALSALVSSNLGHDFYILAQNGLHPVAAAVGIMAIPILLAWNFYSSENQSILRNCSSDKIGTPNSLALSYLEPGSSPTST